MKGWYCEGVFCKRGFHGWGCHEGTPLLVNKRMVRILLECFLVPNVCGFLQKSVKNWNTGCVSVIEMKCCFQVLRVRCINFFFYVFKSALERVILYTQTHHCLSFSSYICLTSLMRAKCGVPSTLCWKIGKISTSIELFGFNFADNNLKLPNLSIHPFVILQKSLEVH